MEMTKTVIKGGEWIIKEVKADDVLFPNNLMKSKKWCLICVINL